MNTPIDFDGINRAALADARSLLPGLIPGGAFRSLEYVVKNPCRDDHHPGSFKINCRSGVWKDFSTGDGGGDLISLVAYIRGGNQSDAARELAIKLGMRLSKPNGSLGTYGRTHNSPVADDLTVPRVFPWGDNGPPVQRDEIRRHPYRNAGGNVVQVKIKYGAGKYANWYRVLNGWQAKKPHDFQSVPYITAALNPFDPELKCDQILWPEGEKDVDTLSKLNLPAFTFGGVGDGLPDGIDEYLTGRHLVILSDNDEAGRAHAEKKAERAYAAGAAPIKVVHFLELPEKGDISDFIANSGTAEQLIARIDATSPWQASTSEAQSSERELVICRASEIAPEPVSWLWPGRIAIGKQTLIAGEPGLGKSQLSIAVIAAVTF